MKWIKTIFIIVNLLFFILYLTLRFDVILYPLSSDSSSFLQNRHSFKQSMDQFWTNYLLSHSIQFKQEEEFSEIFSRLTNTIPVSILDYSNPVFLNSIRFSGTTFSIYRFSLQLSGEYSDVMEFVHQLLRTKYIHLSNHFEIQPLKAGTTRILFIGNFHITVRSEK